MANIRSKNILLIIGIPVLYALLLRFVFGYETWSAVFSVMSISFIFCVPGIIGGLTVYLSPVEQAKNSAYRIAMPWVPIGIFMVITILFTLEGWACWFMVLPLFMISASIGGWIGGRLKVKKSEKNKLYVSLITLMPLILSPVESMIGAIPGTYKAYTYIDIHAPADRIWSQVTRVKEIRADQDRGWLTRSLGFPRPVKAELNYEGVGAYREAIFTNGLVFHETVTEYIHQQKMVFTIKANPHEIPSATMDEHVVIGGEYFDVLNGTYELESLNATTYRLHLYSHFKLNTTFNFYAGWWAKWIMKDIQNNILQVEKQRAEASVLTLF